MQVAFFCNFLFKTIQKFYLAHAETEIIKMIKEACVETLEEAILAEKRGANRIELCTDLAKDGLTPPYELIKKVCSTLKIPVMVMARPRAGDFVFSEIEIQKTKQDIDLAKKAGAAGIVLGFGFV